MPAARRGAALTPKAAPPSAPGFDLGPQCHAAPGPAKIADAGGSPQLARRPQPGAGRPHFAFPATTASAAGARGCALKTTRIRGLAAATRPLPLVNSEAVRIPVTAPACRPERARGERRPRRPLVSRNERRVGGRRRDRRRCPCPQGRSAGSATVARCDRRVARARPGGDVGEPVGVRAASTNGARRLQLTVVARAARRRRRQPSSSAVAAAATSTTRAPTPAVWTILAPAAPSR
jgi:hypothetical protein